MEKEFGAIRNLEKITNKKVHKMAKHTKTIIVLTINTRNKLQHTEKMTNSEKRVTGTRCNRKKYRVHYFYILA